MSFRQPRLAVLGCAALLVAAASAADPPVDKEVVIIGAGAAGLAAAKVLHAAGVDFVVLEADTRLGGRVKKTTWAGLTIEKGANWIHGPQTNRGENNPLWDFKLEYDLKGNVTDYADYKMLTRKGIAVSDEISDQWERRSHNAFEKCLRVMEKMWREAEKNNYEPLEKNDISIRQCLIDQNYSRKADTPLKKDVAETFVWKEVDFLYTTRPKDVSNMWAWPANGNYINEDFLITDPRGFGFFLEEIAKDFQGSIEFGQTVKSVKYSSSGVEVQTKCGHTVSARYAISTLPLGVMQAGTVKFDPPFDEAKRSAIDGMAMGYYAKVYLKFPHNFWGQQETLMVTGEPEGWITWGLNLDHPKYFPGSNVLNFHFSGTFAKQVETQCKLKTYLAIMSSLRKLFPNPPTPIDMYVSDWANNPLTKGSFSTWPLGYTEDEWRLMGQREGNLFFAGEHLEGNYGFLHGALATGEREAKKVLGRLKPATEALTEPEPSAGQGAFASATVQDWLAQPVASRIAAAVAAASQSGSVGGVIFTALAALSVLVAVVSVRRRYRLHAAGSGPGSSFLPLTEVLSSSMSPCDAAEMEKAAEAEEVPIEQA